MDCKKSSSTRHLIAGLLQYNAIEPTAIETFCYGLLMEISCRLPTTGKVCSSSPTRKKLWMANREASETIKLVPSAEQEQHLLTLFFPCSQPRLNAMEFLPDWV